MSKNDGGPAFPVAEDHKVAADIEWTCGMSLRDYFACEAMHALMRQLPLQKPGLIERGEIASEAYRMADAMLKARSA